MEFRNHTSFPALAFEGIDQHAQAFHVVVLRQTLAWDHSGHLDYTDAQAPLCEVDEFAGDMNSSSVLQESDLCHYKPRCDVIANATAHAPGGRPTRGFDIRLKLSRPPQPRPVPEPPRGLNPFMRASNVEMQRWRQDVERAQATPIPGDVLIDKSLRISGPRYFEKKPALARLLQGLVKWTTFNLIQPVPWQLFPPQPITRLPVRHEHAYGGSCRINQRDNTHLAGLHSDVAADLPDSPRFAKRVPQSARLTAEQLTAHPDLDSNAALQPVAHTFYEANPIGTGYTAAWFLAATGLKRFPAPQIEHPANPITARDFWQASHGKFPAAQGASLAPAGFGFLHKGYPERRRLVGTIDEAFMRSDAWLPPDFDFAVWNGAPTDQQTDFLHGDEVLELTNLCAPDAPGARKDDDGNTRLTLTLSGYECYLRVRFKSGAIVIHPMVIDTLIVAPETCLLTVVWRAVLTKDSDTPIRVLEAHTRSLQERRASEQRIEQLRAELQRRTHSHATSARGRMHG